MNHFSKKIFILDDILSKNECDELIELHNTNYSNHVWEGSEPLPLYNWQDYWFFSEKILKVESSVNNLLHEKVAVDWCAIVRWPINSRQNLHYDHAADSTVFTSITYLNDNYSGGNTFIHNDISVIPKTGRSVSFDGKHYYHGVSPVEKNIRYTLAIWYKKT